MYSVQIHPSIIRKLTTIIPSIHNSETYNLHSIHTPLRCVFRSLPSLVPFFPFHGGELLRFGARKRAFLPSRQARTTRQPLISPLPCRSSHPSISNFGIARIPRSNFPGPVHVFPFAIIRC
jgi:hypothetical protein